MRPWRWGDESSSDDKRSFGIAHTELPGTAAHPFYAMGRPSLAPGRYFRLLLIGYFEGIDSERGIAWRAADSLALATK
jgi:transposase